MYIPVSLQYVDQVIHCLCTDFHAIFLHNMIKIATLFSTIPSSKQENKAYKKINSRQCDSDCWLADVNKVAWRTLCLLNLSFMSDKHITEALWKAVSLFQYCALYQMKLVLNRMNKIKKTFRNIWWIKVTLNNCIYLMYSIKTLNNMS